MHIFILYTKINTNIIGEREDDILMPTTIVQSMFNESPSNTWVFVGGEETAGSYVQSGFARNFIGQFEEYIRWTKSLSEFSRQRYMINSGKSGYHIDMINADFLNLITQFNPKAVVYLAGKEDFGISDLPKFKEDLYLFIKKSLALRGEHSYCILLTPHVYKNSDENQKASKCAQIMQELYQSLSLLQKKRVLLVPCYEKTNTPEFMEKCLHPNGTLNAVGHLFLAKLLALFTFGSIADFPVSSQELKTIPGALEAKEALKDNIFSFSDGVLNDLQKEIQQQLQIKSSAAWLFIGDSITHGALHTHGFDSVPQLFEKYIHETYERKNDIIINTGVSGATTQTQLQHTTERLDLYPADFVVIMFGTNDAASSEAISLSKFKKNLLLLLEAVRRKSAIPILRTPNPISPKEERGIMLPDYAQVIRETAKEQHILLIDHFYEWMTMLKKYPFLWEDGYWNSDAVHPNALGQIQMAQSLIKSCGLWKKEKNYFLQL